MPLLKQTVQKSIGQSSGHFELLVISKTSSIEVLNFISPWMRFWARPTRFFWPKGSRGLLEVNFKGVMETSSRRISNISLEQEFNWKSNWKNLIALLNWPLHKKLWTGLKAQFGDKSQSEILGFRVCLL